MQELQTAEIMSETPEWGRITWRLSPGLAEAGASLAVGDVVLLPAKAQELHYHPDADELTYVISGEGQHELAGNAPSAISAGDVFCVPKGILHRMCNTGTGDLQLLVIYTPGGPVASVSVSEIGDRVASGRDAELGRSWMDAAKQEVAHWSQW